jgi:putative ABC transport system permease protein
MNTIALDAGSLLIVYAMLLLPLSLFCALGLKLVRTTLWATLRMSVQLLLVGLYLRYIFAFNQWWLNTVWVLTMVIVANVTVLNNSGLKKRKLFGPTLLGTGGGALAVVSIFIFGAIRPDPFFDARYLIPISGMVLGNCLRANVVALERFYSAIRRNRKDFITTLLLGATLREACRPYLRQTLTAALAPTTATMMTTGIVALPGMMTGQILGGALPVVAIQYQIAIMIAIFVATALSTYLNIALSIPLAFTRYSLLDETIFAKT